MKKSVIIIGANRAGFSCAQRLLSSDQDIHITLISDDKNVAYNRAPLSKSLRPGEPLSVVKLDESNCLSSSRLTLFAGQRATAIDPEKKTVEVNGIDLHYDKLVIATGTQPRTPSIFDIPDAPVMTLHTQADAEAIKARLESIHSPRVGIVGGGFVGLEVAASLSNICKVDLFEARPRLLTRILPVGIADRIAKRHQEAGVALHMEAHIADVQGHKDSIYVELTSGAKFEFDIVILGLGVSPNIELAQEAGLTLANGIAVNTFLETSADSVYAIGDCCSFPLFTNHELIRVESWRNAKEQGEHVADEILNANQVEYRGLPLFWSDQYELSLQMSGWPHPEALRVNREEGDTLLTFELDAEHRMIAVAGIGRGDAVAEDIKLCERMITERAKISVEQLSDPNVSLKAMLDSLG